MAVMSTTYRSSILIEYAEDGSILSRSQTNTTLVRDGDTLLAPPKLEGVTLDEAILAAAIGETAAAVSAQVTTLTADKATALAAQATAEAALATMTAARAAAVADKESAASAHAAALAALQAQLDTANATIESLQSQPLPAEPVVTALQGRLALHSEGLLETVQKTIDSLPSDDPSRLYWEYATQFHRHNPILLQIAALLALTDQQIDDLFKLAATFT